MQCWIHVALSFRTCLCAVELACLYFHSSSCDIDLLGFSARHCSTRLRLCSEIHVLYILLRLLPNTLFAVVFAVYNNTFHTSSSVLTSSTNANCSNLFSICIAYCVVISLSSSPSVRILSGRYFFHFFLSVVSHRH